MANTTVQVRGCIMITGLDADWSLATDLATYANSGIVVASIQFNPSAVNDVMKVTDGLTDAVTITPFHVICSAVSDVKIKYFNPAELMFPFIDVTDCTLGTAANAKVVIHFINWVGRPTNKQL